jgi:uncharacterized repeat protein (TIGR01451 family)
MLQAATADPTSLPPLTVTKQALPDPVAPGALLTYTVRATNNDTQDLHTSITDTLPTNVTYTGPLVWTPTITSPGGIWEHTYVVVTVAAGYTGTLVNKVEITTVEGPTAVCYAITNGYKIYLPVTIRNY